MNVKILFKKLDKSAQLPTRAYEGDAGMDLHASLGDVKIIIQPDTIVKIPTNLAMAIPYGWEGQIRPRSGLSSKHGVMVVNAPGTVDSGYRDEIKVALINLGSKPCTVKDGDRIAQLVICRIPEVEIEEVDDLPESKRGKRGFGSSGV